MLLLIVIRVIVCREAILEELLAKIDNKVWLTLL